MPDTERTLAEAVRQRGAGKHLVILLDFDGTLCEFEADPAAVQLPEGVREVLLGLQRHATIGIVSGRRLHDVRERVGIDGIVVAGLHGMEIEGLGERFVHPDIEKAHAAVAEVSEGLQAIASRLPGAFVEAKGPSVALHFRETDLHGQRIAVEEFGILAAPPIERGVLRLMRGSYVLELLPNIDWNKGHAVQWILDRVEQQKGPVFAVYIGDDVTDQDAIRAVEGEGLAIAASDRVSADVHIDGPAAVARFLRAL
ncbi:MAG TPA: trehalose-phosphatase [Vicinamibacterales bacterium]|nr:trehalose-phosphatase [Vicinamibacterales bacterium]